MPKLLSLVVCMTLLTWLTVLVASLIRAKAWTPKGLMLAFGNRDNLPEATPLAGRAQRAAANSLENLLFFAALALVAQAAGATNERVLLGAQVFLWARVIYVPVYVIGVPFVRTGVWTVSIVGLAMMVMGMT
ncbi:MAPEG family protein [Roseateles sp. NT4]|uniref:MAPEG family protein n=1 Tax=Roseateles sp. NT4 TaxID=3453715 RepID=UPI003EE95ADE